MTIGVVTAGYYGQERDFAALGVERWIEAEAAWKQVADLDSPGLFVYSDGGRWEVRISGLDAQRRDGFKRPIRNSLVVQGEAGSDSELAAAAVRCGAASRGFAELEGAVAKILTPGRVEALFTGAASTANLADPVHRIAAQLAIPDPTDARAGSWLVGEETPGAVSALIEYAARLADGNIGVVARGVTYPEPEGPTIGDLLLVESGSSQPWSAVPKPPTQTPTAPRGGHPKAIPPAILLLAVLAILLVILALVVM